jgi:hypothetical protein
VTVSCWLWQSARPYSSAERPERWSGAQAAAPVDSYRIVNVYPHDPTAYTQGLIFHDGFLFESTGLNGRSTLRKIVLETGEVVQQRRRAQRGPLVCRDVRSTEHAIQFQFSRTLVQR